MQRWWREDGEGPPRPAKFALAVILALTLIMAFWRQLTKVEGLGPLPWTEEITEHLQGLAAEWDVSSASNYAKAITDASSIDALISSIDQVLHASQMGLAKEGADGADPILAKKTEEDALLLAAALACLGLTDLSSRSLIPQIVRFRGDAQYWSERIMPLWRLSFETLSPPLGPALATKFPERSLERRIHECKVLKTAADSAAGAAQEALGRLHSALAPLGAARGTEQLRLAVHDTTGEMEQVLSRLDLARPSGSDRDKEGRDRAAEKDKANGVDARASLLRIRKCAVAHPHLGLLLDEQGLLASSHRHYWLQRRWPEVVVGVIALAAGVKARDPRELAMTLTSHLQTFAAYSAALLRENLKGPLERIGTMLFEKPTSFGLGNQVKDSTQILKRMVDTFNTEINGLAARDAGMKGVMGVYEKEIRTPLKGALNGRMLRAGLIQVQEMKVNFETEMATVQRLLETQQLNLQIVAMLPAVTVVVVAGFSLAGFMRFLSKDPLRPQQDLEAVLHDMSRAILAERTKPVGSAAAQRARGHRCLLAWEARRLLYMGSVPVPAREARQLRIDVARLASPQLPPEHLAMHLEGVFRQLPRTTVSFRM